MSYQPNPIHFRKERFLTRGKHDLRKTKIVSVPAIRVKLEKGDIILHKDTTLTPAELKQFNKAEKNKYLIKKENGRNQKTPRK